MRECYEIAEKVIEVDSLYPAVHDYCAEYRSKKTADFAIAITREDLIQEQTLVDQERMAEGLEPIRMEPDYLEITAALRLISERMPTYDTFLFHSSAVAVDGMAYLFAALSGTGKSTHTRLWREMLGKRAVMVNDDKPFIRVQDEKAMVFGTPWDGKHRLSQNIAVPIKAICLLERDRENHIEPVCFRDVYPRILQQMYRPFDPIAMAQSLSLLDRLFDSISLYRLGCNMEPEAACVAYYVMKG